ncbi:AAA family ATPase [Mangrovactinospora gilvigrisea]|uniref:AAA family ATPase n=1 Tax=Mangrovactinospora gilvigrisea TaxID=1428644 RepID=A0A1J7C699_9ACTN|nr:AAA family ATPase [Mangrovactinospora gilvigrisea]OIV37060.1 AAA family ATPase [Mangrovactinospora gilvigrisea]
MRPTTDDPLELERAHLRESRAALRAMRKDFENLDLTDIAASWVSAEVVRGEVRDRIKTLADLAELPLFFGRVDYLHPPGGAPAGEDDGPERYYIGRRHVHDAGGEPMVLDWRAPVSQPFYRASRTEPLDVALRRRFGYERGELTAYEDEHLTDPAEAATASRLLAAEIEKPRVGPMRDIVATIQPEQDVIVRMDIGDTLCVQGAPGTGKTAVGLHRVAYLLYSHRERLKRTGTLVVGPNDSFLHYIEQVLPSLGELDVAQATVGELVGKQTGLAVRGTDTARAAGLKGDARMAEVLRGAVRSHVGRVEESLVLVRGSRRWRVPQHELQELVDQLLEREMRYGAARDALPQRIAHAVLTRMELAGEAPDDRVQNAVARSAPVKAVVKAVWPAVDPAKLVLRLLSDAEFLAAAADGLLTEDEQAAVRWAKPARGVKTAPWTAADLVLVDEALDLVERTGSLGHVVLDEAQDLSPMQYRAVGRRCSTGSATVLGDIAQGTTPWATGSWEEALLHLGKKGAAVEELTAGFRVPKEIIDYASRLLPHIAEGLAPASSVREALGSLTRREDGDVAAAVRGALRHEGSVGVIVADARMAQVRSALEAAGVAFLDDPGAETTQERRVTLLPASLAKGLEYDHVVVDEPSLIVEGEPDRRTGLRRLYVVLTRAVSGLTVVHSVPLPEELAA